MGFFDYLKVIIGSVLELMSFEFNFGGLKFSFLAFFIGISLLSLIIWAVGKLFD